MQTVVVSIGGSILVPKASDVDNIIEIAALLDDLAEERKLYVVVGGGRYARTYLNSAGTWGRRSGTWTSWAYSSPASTRTFCAWPWRDGTCLRRYRRP